MELAYDSESTFFLFVCDKKTNKAPTLVRDNRTSPVHVVSVTTMGKDSVLGQSAQQGSRPRLKRSEKFSRERDPRLGPERSVSGRIENRAGEELQPSKPGNHQ